MFHDLIRTQLILPYVKGDFYEGHLSEAAGGKFVALEKPNDSVRPVIIGLEIIIDLPIGFPINNIISLGLTGGGHRPPSPSQRSTAMSSIS